MLPLLAQSLLLDGASLSCCCVATGPVMVGDNLLSTCARQSTLSASGQHAVERFLSGAGPPAQPLLVRKAAAYVTRILTVFGISTAAPDQVGFGGEASAAVSAGEGAAKYLDAFALFRDTVRGMAKAGKSSGDMLAACDR